MVRLLLVVFFVGLVISIGCSATVAALGGAPYHRWAPGWINDGDRHGWGWRQDYGDDPGPSTTRDFAWTPEDRLQIDVPADINYTQGPIAKITASGGQHELDDLEVDGDRIRFRHRHHWESDGHLELTITAPSVREFQLNGAQKLDISNYAQDSLGLQVNGAAQVNASGSAKDLKLQLNGAGQGNLRDLANETAEVQINGAGDAVLATTKDANVEINGVGHARLINSPSFHQSIHGFGTVELGPDGEGEAKPAPAPPAQPAAPAPPAKPAATNSRARAA